MNDDFEQIGRMVTGTSVSYFIRYDDVFYLRYEPGKIGDGLATIELMRVPGPDCPPVTSEDMVYDGNMEFLPVDFSSYRTVFGELYRRLVALNESFPGDQLPEEDTLYVDCMTELCENIVAQIKTPGAVTTSNMGHA